MNTVAYFPRPAEAPLPELSPPAFKAILVADCPVTEGWREQVAEWLVRGGCLYLVTWGEACEAWHDSVDVGNSHDFAWQTIPDDKFVMTTWHERESLEEAMWFAAHNAEHPTVDLVATLMDDVRLLGETYTELGEVDLHLLARQRLEAYREALAATSRP